MLLLLGLLWMAQAAAPFWEAVPPKDWTDEQVKQLFFSSPWARREETTVETGDSSTKLPFKAVHFFLATAKPMQLAEQEMRNRDPNREDPLLEEYLDFLKDNPGRYIILAVFVAVPQYLTEKRTHEMEDKCFLRVGKRKYRMVGHFPPTQWDPYLRLVFPRDIQPDDQTLSFDLYLPGVPAPFRSVDFPIKSLIYNGQPEM